MLYAFQYMKARLKQLDMAVSYCEGLNLKGHKAAVGNL